MKSITLEIEIKADMDRVWEYWTQPNHIIHWNFASEDWCCPSAENQMVPNGKFSWRMEAKDGSVGFDFEGIYDQVVTNKLITYRMLDNRAVTIKFLQLDDCILLQETFETEDIHSAEHQCAGWQSILENFKKYVESEK